MELHTYDSLGEYQKDRVVDEIKRIYGTGFVTPKRARYTMRSLYYKRHSRGLTTKLGSPCKIIGKCLHRGNTTNLRLLSGEITNPVFVCRGRCK